jgi:hypothetical protein
MSVMGIGFEQKGFQIKILQKTSTAGLSKPNLSFIYATLPNPRFFCKLLNNSNLQKLIPIKSAV